MKWAIGQDGGKDFHSVVLFSGAVKKSPILTVSPTPSTLLNSGQLSVFMLLDLSAWNCSLNCKFIYPTSYFNNSTWKSSRHLKLHIFSIKFLLISPPNSFHAHSSHLLIPSFQLFRPKTLTMTISSTLFFSVVSTLDVPGNVVHSTLEICQNPPSLLLLLHPRKNYHLSSDLIQSPNWFPCFHLSPHNFCSREQPELPFQNIFQITNLVFLLSSNGSSLHS